MSSLKLNNLMRWTFGLVIASLPFQINVLTYQPAWGRGFLNPYTSITFSMTELLLLIAGILFFINLKQQKKHINIGEKTFFFLFLAILLVISISLFISPYVDPELHFLLSIKILSFLIFYILVVNKVLHARNLLEIFIVSMSFQALLAFTQVVLQHDLGLYILGEPHLSDTVAHIARFTFNGTEIIRGYGTFPHPNVLGGFLLISILSSLLYSPHLRFERRFLIIAQFIGLLATFSRTAILALIIGIVIIFIWYLKEIQKTKTKLIALTLTTLFTVEFIFLWLSRGLNILTDSSLIERWEGVKLAWQIFIKYPLGIGFSHYTLFLDEVTSNTLMPWEYQPVHNIPLLILTETGIFGLVIITLTAIYTFRRIFHKRKILLTRNQRFKKRVLFVIFLTIGVVSFFDHYFASLDQGRWIISILFGILSSFSVNPRTVLPIKKEENLNRILACQ